MEISCQGGGLRKGRSFGTTGLVGGRGGRKKSCADSKRCLWQGEFSAYSYTSLLCCLHTLDVFSTYTLWSMKASSARIYFNAENFNPPLTIVSQS